MRVSAALKRMKVVKPRNEFVKNFFAKELDKVNDSVKTDQSNEMDDVLMDVMENCVGKDVEKFNNGISCLDNVLESMNMMNEIKEIWNK